MTKPDEPCPFCGSSNAVLEDMWNGGRIDLFVKCQNCQARGPMIIDRLNDPANKPAAIRTILAWNTRTKIDKGREAMTPTFNDNELRKALLDDDSSVDPGRLMQIARAALLHYSQMLPKHNELCAKLLELTTDELLLIAGEMTAQELRTVRAVLANRAAAIRRLTNDK